MLNKWSQQRALAVLMGGMVWGLASNAQAETETEYWYYDGELTTPADSRAVLSPYRLPVWHQLPSAFAKPKSNGWDWQKRKQAYLKMRQSSLQSPVSVHPPSSLQPSVSVRPHSVGLVAVSMRPTTTKVVAHALPFWPDIPVIKVR